MPDSAVTPQHPATPQLAPPRGHEPFPVPWMSIRDRFDVVADWLPEQTAVVCQGEHITYSELRERAIGGARALVKSRKGVRRPIAIDTECTLDCVVAIVTVLVSGYPLVLLDSQLPEQRRTDILTRSHAARVRPSELAALPPSPDTPLHSGAPTDTAVLLFTSGSTGKPKAVRQGQRLWLNQAADFHTTLGTGASDRVGMALPISFGGGLDVVMTSLLNGATLHFLDPREVGIDAVPHWISSEQLTTLHATPSLLRAVMTACADTPSLSGLRLVTTCGEAVHGADVTRLRALLGPDASYCNLSGSSETGNLAFNAFPPGRPVPDGVLPVGVVAANKTVRLLGPDDAPVGPGEVGQIVVESDYLAEGYFVDGFGPGPLDDRFGTTDRGARSFRMGDLGRFDDDGFLHLVGRGDDAVKIRGYLVEPSEVESALRKIPAVEDAVVVARKLDNGSTTLVGYAALAQGDRAPSVADLRCELRSLLPDWMVPTNIVLMPTLPRNERGKVDRTALPDPTPRPPVVLPRSDTETTVAALWSQILGVDPIGRDDDFVSLGGDSLQTQQMLTQVEERFAVQFSSATLAGFPTLRQFSAHLDGTNSGAVAATSVLVPLHPDGIGRPVFAFAGAGSTALALLPLARELSRPVHGLQAHGLESRGLPDWTVAAAARRFLREIRRVQPHGPYAFVGHSLGGVIAMEVARLLEADGHHVQIVICLDTILGGPLSEGGPDLPRTAGTRPAVDGPAPSRGALWRTRFRLLTAGIVPRPAQKQWDLFHELGRRVALLHKLQPWHGRVAVVMAEDNPDEPSWWSIIAPNVVSVDRVSGDHVGMLRAPHVARTAALVRTALGDKT
ncbi:putative non-ribosomal peptide synthetase [Rhodococcus sp. RD6.2]|uniref:alpha/beta fold hydrolase n=1 Tax=Rhodococcus sp. RD6.2 TaxID=260936 RepID=UPI00063B73A8|nr:alpha/beta fold hydrolase [Rhodococcus sp. RD6.2]CRK49612.1 putative non-ribosomal peptide synthetase [Rhodococcus sp. RD6.2]